MALGGGTFTSQNKILPGTYINFVNPSLASSGISERGVVAVPLTLNFGEEGKLIEINSETVYDDTKKKLGYDFSSNEMVAVRELMKNAKKLYVYRLSSSAEKAQNAYATAKTGGLRGNDIKISISNSPDKVGFFYVSTYLETQLIETQEVQSASELSSNDYVDFKADSGLTPTAMAPLSGGSNGESVTGSDYINFLNLCENYAFDILCCPTADIDTINIFISYLKRMNTESGANFQLVAYRTQNSDYEGVISVENTVLSGLPEWGLVYWTAGAQANAALGESLTGKVYDGELEIDLNYTQTELKDGISAGKFMIHSVSGEPRVLRDINSLTSFTHDKGESFSSNQTIRVCMAVSNSVAKLFAEKYLGTASNDNAGRLSLWNDICKLLEDFRDTGAISEFSTEDVSIKQGDSKQSVVCTVNNLLVAGSMETLYMNVTVI